MECQQSKILNHQRHRYGMVLLLVSSLASRCEAFVQPPPQHVASPSSWMMTTAEALPDISEVLNGEKSCVDPLAKVFIESTDAPLSEDTPTSFAPPLTYDKYLTMQSKRVPVCVKYSEQSGLRPYYLTVARKIKEQFPDVILDKVLVPKVEVSEYSTETSKFEVVVDGKSVIRSPSRKGALVGEHIHVFVNMQEIEAAIVRARKRRRPQTVYGEEDSNARLEILKNKTMEKDRWD